MNAREMFEKLGYEEQFNGSDIYINRKYGSRIAFDDYNGGTIDVVELCYIPRELLKAINIRCQELGWLEEEKQEIKQETNIDHYKDGIIELCVDDLAISKGKVVKCCATPCSECDFEDKNGHCIGNREIMEWLKQPYIKPVYKLTKFEIDLLQSCSQGYSPKYQFKNINSLTEMRKNGYFKGVNRDATIEEIIEKSEVVG